MSIPKLTLEPSDKIPEVKKTVCFCSSRCANNFAGRIRAERTKKRKASIRKELETLDHYPTHEEMAAIFQTLTPSEKYQIILTSLVACFNGLNRMTIKEFYKYLSEMSK